MDTFLLIVLVLDGLFLGTVILLQAGKGGGLAAMGGGAAATDGILAGRQATTILTRATWASGTLFLVLAFILSILSSRTSQPESILGGELGPTAPQPTPVLPLGDTGGGEVLPPPGGEGGGGSGEGGTGEGSGGAGGDEDPDAGSGAGR